MGVTEQFERAMRAAGADDVVLPDRLAVACAAAVPMDAAGLTFTLTPGRRLPVGASDDTSRLAERLQFTVGEGPCLSAHDTVGVIRASPVELSDRWPVYWGQLTQHTPFRSVVALPLTGSLTATATVELYSRDPGAAHDLPAASIAELAQVVDAWLVAGLTGSGEQHLGLPTWLEAPTVLARRAVWQAVGYLSAVEDLSTRDALALLRSRAYGRDVDLEAVAQDVLSDDGDGDDDGDPVDGGRMHLLSVLPAGSAAATGTDGRPVPTSVPRGPHGDEQLLCGSCGAVLARGHRPESVAVHTRRLRCARCGAVNGTTSSMA